MTIGPLLLLGLLAVTFHVGSKPTGTGTETLDDLGTRTKCRGELAVERDISCGATEGVSVAPLSSNSNTKVIDSPSAPAQVATEDGVMNKGDDTQSANDSHVSKRAQSSWIIHYHSEAVVEAGVTSSTPPAAPRERLRKASGRSMRSIWKAGPGNIADPEQVIFLARISRRGGGKSGSVPTPATSVVLCMLEVCVPRWYTFVAVQCIQYRDYSCIFCAHGKFCRSFRALFITLHFT